MTPFRRISPLLSLRSYLGDCGSYEQCMAPDSGVFAMRLQQQAGAAAAGARAGTVDRPTALTTVTPTYDLGCPPGFDSSTKTATCPFGTVRARFASAPSPQHAHISLFPSKCVRAYV